MADPIAPVRGLVDRHGRLAEADPALLALHLRSGGEEGGVIATPQLAALVRLVRRIGIVVSRGVLVADEDGDLDLWVRAQPQGSDVRLAIAGWTPRPTMPSFAAIARERDFASTGVDWTWASDAALRLTALDPPHGAAGPGDPLTRLFTLMPDAQDALPILAALAGHRPFENQRATIGGIAVSLSGTPLLDPAGRFAGISGIAVIAAETPGRMAEPASVDAFGERLDAALRGPLDRIVANAETIRVQSDGPLRRDYAAYATDIAIAGRHLLALVGDLVDLQAIERSDFHVTCELLDLADIARRASGLLGVRAADRGVRIDRPGDGETVPVAGDFRRVLQILVNLIGNAVRYSPEGGLLSVRVAADSGTATVVVGDQGRGLAFEDQTRIFEKFERVDPTEPGGTGLGLYISRRLARAMGGDISVDSAPGEGARFTLTLPSG